jgi:hypothetical protein
MRDLKDIERAFGDVAAEDEPVQRLLRPLLLRATQDPGLMRSLATHSLSQHLPFVGELLMDGQALEPRALPSLTAFLGLSQGVEDAEEAFEFTKRLPATLRDRVAAALCSALESRALHDGSGLSLLAVARLLALAFDDLPYLTHVLAGREVAAFPADAAASGAPNPVPPAPQPKSQARSKRRKESSGLLEAEAVLEPQAPLPERRGKK